MMAVGQDPSWLPYVGSAVFLVGVAWWAMRWTRRTVEKDLNTANTARMRESMSFAAGAAPQALIKEALAKGLVTSTQLATMSPVERQFLFAQLAPKLAPKFAAAREGDAAPLTSAHRPSVSIVPKTHVDVPQLRSTQAIPVMRRTGVDLPPLTPEQLAALGPPVFDNPAALPRGFRSASRNVGLKPEAKDLALFVSDVDCAAAAVFTRNQFPGAPVVLGRQTIAGGVLRAIIVNSKVSNVATGEEGVARATRMAAAAAREVGTDAAKVLVSSTGVIGVPLPIEKIEAGIAGMAAELTADPMPGAHGIMTTDTHPKVLSCLVGPATITWIAKGAGMIEPNMATMLVYIFTDAGLAAPELDVMLRRAVDVSFNMLSVDTDTSTSDTCAVLANGLAGAVDAAAFEAAMTAGCVRMAEVIARDGEGAGHLIRVAVRGAKDRADARTVAKSVVNSPLVKTMVAGADPNVGRLLMAIGKCFDATIAPVGTDAWINRHQVVTGGARATFDDAVVREALGAEVIDIEIALGVGDAQATAFGCDLTQGYIEENAGYYSS